MATDRNLVQRLRSGDHAAFEALYARHKARLYRHALAHTGARPAIAEEVVQDVFLSLFTREGEIAHVASYLLSAVRNRALNAIQRREDRAVPLGDAAVALLVRGDGPERVAGRREEAHLLAQGLLALPPAQREVVLLRTFEALPWKEIAALTGAPVPTLSARYRAALTTLRTRCRSLSHA
jgi:RNA polymerase sigma-70 factor (ECF subfamily)